MKKFDPPVKDVCCDEDVIINLSAENKHLKDEITRLNTILEKIKEDIEKRYDPLMLLRDEAGYHGR